MLASTTIPSDVEAITGDHCPGVAYDELIDDDDDYYCAFT